MVYADDGNVTQYVNPQIEQILGVTPEAYQADPDMWLRMVHPDDRMRVEAQSEAFIAGSGGDLDDYRMVRPDGRVVGSATAPTRIATPTAGRRSSTGSCST